MLISRNSQEKCYDKDVYISNNPLVRVHYAKFLGVYIDDNLNWKKHISFVCNKVAKNIGIISRIRRVLPLKILISLYYTLVYPFLTYCNVVWASTYKTNLNHLFSLQKRFVRMATFSEPRTSSGPLFQNLALLDIYKINTYQICLFVFQHQMNLLPPIFSNFFQSNNAIHSYDTRKAEDLHPPFYSSTYGQLTVRYQGPKQWNDLPEYLKKCRHLHAFKKRLKKYLILTH